MRRGACGLARTPSAARPRGTCLPRSADRGGALGDTVVSPRRSSYIEVTSPVAVGGLLAEIFSAERAYPVVALTMSPYPGAPSFDPLEVRAVIPVEARLYLVPPGRFERELSASLPFGLGLAPSAVRIWWPGLSVRSNPLDHPMVRVWSADGEGRALAELARVSERPRSAWAVRGGADAAFRDRRGRPPSAEGPRPGDQRRADAGHARSCRPDVAPSDMTTSSTLSLAPDGPVLDAEAHEARLRIAIVEQWEECLTPAERCEHPLHPHCLTRAFLRDTLALATTDRYCAVARACALIACGWCPNRPKTRGLIAEQGPVVTRVDGAAAWFSPIAGTDELFVHYWVHHSGVIEFETVDLALTSGMWPDELTERGC